MKDIDQILKEFDVSTEWDSFFIKDWLPEELFLPLKSLIVQSYVDGKDLRYIEEFGRWTCDIDFSVIPEFQSLNYYVREALRKYDKDWDKYTLQGHFGWKYQAIGDSTPALDPHIDSYGGNIIFDICLESTIDWTLDIADKSYKTTRPNEVIVFNGQTLMHSRPSWNDFSKSEDDYVIVMFFVASKLDHWSRTLGIDYLEVFKRIQYLHGLPKNDILGIENVRREIELMYDAISSRKEN
jgi:hypothetical protein